MRSACLRFFALLAAVAFAAPLSAQPVPTGPELPLSAPTQPDEAYEVAVAGAADGSFLAVWNGEDLGIWSRVFPADSPLALGSVQLRPSPGPLVRTSGTHPRAAALAGGGYVAVWENQYPAVVGGPQLPAGNTLSFRLLDAVGQPITAETVVEEDMVGSEVVADPAGGFLLVYQTGTEVIGRRFDDQGHPSGGRMSLGGGLSDMAGLPDGGFAVVWVQGPASQTQVLLRVFGPDGAPRSAATLVQADAAQNQAHPRISADLAGRLVVVWEAGLTTPGNPPNVLARRFGPDGAPLGPALAVSAGSSQAGGAADVSVRPDGSFLVVWPSPEGQVLARAFLPDGTPDGAAFLVPTRPGRKAPPVATSTFRGWIAAWIEGNVSGVPYGRELRSSTACSGLCLRGGRFLAEVSWRVPGTGAQGTGIPIPETSDTGAFWFFAPANYELAVKILDGRGVNGHFWVFYASLTDVEFDLTVTDLATGEQRTYHNSAGTMASQADTEAFPQ